MSREQLEKFAHNLRNEVEREREERNFFQLERDKLRTFWEITKNQLGSYFVSINFILRGPYRARNYSFGYNLAMWQVDVVRLHVQVYHFHFATRLHISHSNQIGNRINKYVHIWIAFSLHRS